MARNVRQIVRCGLQIYPTVHSLSGRRVKDRSGPFAKGRNPPGNGEENLPSPTDCVFPHIGTCLPVGLLRQDPVVRLKMELEECPQYLQKYFRFSSPSQGTCLPVGLLRQDPAVRPDTELEECPQYMQ